MYVNINSVYGAAPEQILEGEQIIVFTKYSDVSGFSAAIYAADILRFATDLRLRYANSILY